jgi:Mlc titration factor MtfA (ptsG expression regulator)/Tfp pilus assembly protein PilF
MIFSFRKKERRQEILTEPFPEEWHAYLRDNVLLYRSLSEAEQSRLRDALRIFIAEKFWEGCRGLQITEEIQVTIAAHACLLTLGFEDFFFDEVQSVLVYPGGYLVPVPSVEKDTLYHLTGMAHHKGPVILSWWNALWDGRRIAHANLVIHEFAHKLAELNDPMEGVPPLDDPDLEQRWGRTMAAEYEQLVKDAEYGRPTLLDPYGATNRSEFFAVTTECFFLQPVPLRRRHPGLYQILAEWYRQDPAERPALVDEDWEDTQRTESEYRRHAIAECSAAIRLHPDLGDAYQRRADLYYDEGEYDQAIADYSAVIRLNPADPETFRDRGAVHRDLGLYDQALADFNEAIRLCPDYAEAYCERAAVYSEEGDFDKALADLGKAIRLDAKDDAAYNQRGLVYCEQGEYEKAIRDFSKALRLYPHSADVYGNRALAHIGKQEYDKAIADCALALEIDSRLPEAYKVRGVAQYHKSNYGQAIADCTEAIRLDPRYADAYRARALAYAALGDEEKAKRDDAEAEKLAMPERQDSGYPLRPFPGSTETTS